MAFHTWVTVVLMSSQALPHLPVTRSRATLKRPDDQVPADLDRRL